MKLAPVSTALFAACATLLLGAPLVAAVCTGAAACPCPGMSAMHVERCPGPVFTVESSCCKRVAAPADAPAPAAHFTPPVAASAATSAFADRILDTPVADSRLPVGASLARAELRHELGLFILHDIFRI